MSLVRMVIYVVCNAYALGLVVYTVLAFMPGAGCVRVRKQIEPLYATPLHVIRTNVNQVFARGRPIDLAPALLLAGIVAVRIIVIYLISIPV